jgi:hypothetical protein
MDQLMLSLVLSIGAARILKAANKPENSLPTVTQPPLPLTPQRLELIKALTREMSRRAEPTAETPPKQTIVAQKYRRPVGQHQPSPVVLVLPKKMWILLGVLIFVALLPNFTLAPLLWLRFLDQPPPPAVTTPPHQSSMVDQSISATGATLSANRSSIVDSVVTPVLSAPSSVEVAVGQNVSLPIAVDGTDGMPPSSRIVVSGLPSGSKLSNGHANSNSEWNLNPDEIGDLRLVLGNKPISDTKLGIQLVAPDGHIVADTATILKMTKPQEGLRSGLETQQTAIQLSSAQPQRFEVIETAEPMHPEALLPTTDSTPLPPRKPKAEDDDGNTKWIKPSRSVNLRKGPSSSAAIISVVEKASKLRAIGRKKGWVQVTNPATSETGWIYAENIGRVR